MFCVHFSVLSQTSVWCCQALRQRVAWLRVSLLCRQASATAPASPRLSPDRLHTHPIRCQVWLKNVIGIWYSWWKWWQRDDLAFQRALQCIQCLCLHFSSLWSNSSSSLCPKVPASLLPQASTPPTTQCPTPPTTLPHSRYINVLKLCECVSLCRAG